MPYRSRRCCRLPGYGFAPQWRERPLAHPRTQARYSDCLRLTSRPTVPVLGASSRNNSRRFAPSGPLIVVTPVALKPGRLRLATRPDLTGSEDVWKTIGILLVAPFATRAGTSPPATKITAT